VNPVLLAILSAGGAAGAAARYLVDLAVTARVDGRFPWGTVVVNVTGSFLLGLVTGVVSDATVLAAAGVGLLGGYTTFSTVNANAAALALAGRTRAAVLTIVTNAGAAVGAAGAGLAAGTLLAG
jgi:CrcB protein